MGGRGDPAAPAANVRRFGFAEQIRHRPRRPAQIPLSSLHELQRGAVPQFPALLHRQSNGKRAKTNITDKKCVWAAGLPAKTTPGGLGYSIDRQKEEKDDGRVNRNANTHTHTHTQNRLSNSRTDDRIVCFELSCRVEPA